MKYLLAISLAIVFGCKEEEPTPADLLSRMQLIEAEIKSITTNICSSNSSCRSSSIGVKACGGPTHYIVYGAVTDEIRLQKLIVEFNGLNEAYNELTKAISDCALVNPPNLSCVSGNCVLLNN